MALEPLQLADLLLEELKHQIRAAGENPEEFCSLTVYSGDTIPYDYALQDYGPMGWVRLTGANPTVAFPNADLAPANCAFTMAYGFEVGILRASIMPRDLMGGGVDLPTPAEHREQAQQQYVDMRTMMNAVLALRAKGRLDDVLLGSYTPVGPDGAVFGGAWTAVVGDS